MGDGERAAGGTAGRLGAGSALRREAGRGTQFVEVPTTRGPPPRRGNGEEQQQLAAAPPPPPPPPPPRAARKPPPPAARPRPRTPPRPSPPPGATQRAGNGGGGGGAPQAAGGSALEADVLSGRMWAPACAAAAPPPPRAIPAAFRDAEEYRAVFEPLLHEEAREGARAAFQEARDAGKGWAAAVAGCARALQQGAGPGSAAGHAACACVRERCAADAAARVRARARGRRLQDMGRGWYSLQLQAADPAAVAGVRDGQLLVLTFEGGGGHGGQHKHKNHHKQQHHKQQQQQQQPQPAPGDAAAASARLAESLGWDPREAPPGKRQRLLDYDGCGARRRPHACTQLPAGPGGGGAAQRVHGRLASGRCARRGARRDLEPEAQPPALGARQAAQQVQQQQQQPAPSGGATPPPSSPPPPLPAWATHVTAIVRGGRRADQRGGIIGAMIHPACPVHAAAGGDGCPPCCAVLPTLRGSLGAPAWRATPADGLVTSARECDTLARLARVKLLAPILRPGALLRAPPGGAARVWPPELSDAVANSGFNAYLRSRRAGAARAARRRVRGRAAPPRGAFTRLAPCSPRAAAPRPRSYDQPQLTAIELAATHAALPPGGGGDGDGDAPREAGGKPLLPFTLIQVGRPRARAADLPPARRAAPVAARPPPRPPAPQRPSPHPPRPARARPARARRTPCWACSTRGTSRSSSATTWPSRRGSWPRRARRGVRARVRARVRAVCLRSPAPRKSRRVRRPALYQSPRPLLRPARAGGGLPEPEPRLAGLKPRILVCAPSNAAVDELLERVLRGGFVGREGGAYRPSVCRVGSDEALNEGVRQARGRGGAGAPPAREGPRRPAALRTAVRFAPPSHPLLRAPQVWAEEMAGRLLALAPEPWRHEARRAEAAVAAAAGRVFSGQVALARVRGAGGGT